MGVRGAMPLYMGWEGVLYGVCYLVIIFMLI